MRECIYCGRSLEKGEKCTCAMSVAKRMSKSGTQSDTKTDNKADKKAEKQAEKARRKEARRVKREQRHAYRQYNFNTKGVFRQMWQLIVSFIKSPVETVMNPGEMSKGLIILFVALEGVIGGLCAFSVTTGAIRGPVGFLGNVMGFKGTAGYSVLGQWAASAFSGAISGIMVFFLYSGIFYIVNKWIFKQFTPYWEFVKRFAFAPLPFTVIGAVGVILGIFSQLTFIVLLLCGIIGTILITYEILKSVWYSKSADKIIYTMMLCVFVFLMILIYFVSIV